MCGSQLPDVGARLEKAEARALRVAPRGFHPPCKKNTALQAKHLAHGALLQVVAFPLPPGKEGRAAANAGLVGASVLVTVSTRDLSLGWIQ